MMPIPASFDKIKTRSRSRRDLVQTSFGDDELPMQGSAAWQDNSIGQSIGKYELLEQLNAGGQGTVYRAWDRQLQRDVAIKLSHLPLDEVLPPPTDNDAPWEPDDQNGTSQKSSNGQEPLSASRVIQEGALLARIDHPHLARVYDCGLHHGRPFLVLEFVSGVSLQTFVQQQSVPDRQLLRWMDEISGAVTAAHQAGILHLDLKPENVMLTPQGHCKLIDFGLGWNLSQQSLPFPLVMGTCEYLSPEQAQGASLAWTEATDVFGLGGMLYALLMGSPPMPAQLLDAESCKQRLNKVDRQLEQLKEHTFLAGICRKSLAYDPQLRFRNAAEFRQAVKSHRRRGELILAKSLLLLGTMLVCLGLFMNKQLGQTDRNGKEMVQQGHASSISNRIRLHVEIQATSSQTPQVWFWSPSLGLHELRGMKSTPTATGQVWRPRTGMEKLRIPTLDETLCILVLHEAIPVSVLEQLPEFCDSPSWADTVWKETASKGTTWKDAVSQRPGAIPDYLVTPQRIVSSAPVLDQRVQQALEDFRQSLIRLPVPFTCLISTRSLTGTPHWEIDARCDIR